MSTNPGSASRTVWPVVVLAAVAMVVAGVLAFAKVDKEVLLLILTATATPVLGALISMQMGETKGTVQAVQQQTNGNTTRMLEIMDRQSRDLAAAHPPATPATPAAPTGPTGPTALPDLPRHGNPEAAAA